MTDPPTLVKINQRACESDISTRGGAQARHAAINIELYTGAAAGFSRTLPAASLRNPDPAAADGKTGVFHVEITAVSALLCENSLT